MGRIANSGVKGFFLVIFSNEDGKGLVGHSRPIVMGLSEHLHSVLNHVKETWRIEICLEILSF